MIGEMFLLALFILLVMLSIGGILDRKNLQRGKFYDMLIGSIAAITLIVLVIFTVTIL
jgi:hypothetical protein